MSADRWLARIFGLRVVGIDDDPEAVGYWWRGKLYITRMTRPGRLADTVREDRP